MNQQYKLFIQCNRKQYVGAKVAEYTFRKNSTSKEFDIEIMMDDQYPQLYQREGQFHLREGKRVVWRNDLQSFTPTRFLPPKLMGYKGIAIVIDPDVFAICDCMELFKKDMKGKAIWARKVVDPKRGDYWASSVMLLDCSQLKHWRWDEDIQAMFDLKKDYRKWMSLEYEDQSTIGELEEEWNHYDKLNEKTKFMHNTSRVTQPWKTGLPIDFSYSHKKYKPSFGARIKRFFLKSDTYDNKPHQGTYLQHPDPKQEEYFFNMLAQTISAGMLSPQIIHQEIESGNIRKDTFEILGSSFS